MMISIFNALLSSSGYSVPQGATVEQLQQLVQPDSARNMITFCFVGMEVFTGAILAVLLVFLSVEKTVDRKQRVIRERQKAAVIASGEEWIEPEIRAAEEIKKQDEEAEEIFRNELKARCEKKGLNYDEELAKHIALMEEKGKKRQKRKSLTKRKPPKKPQSVRRGWFKRRVSLPTSKRRRGKHVNWLIAKRLMNCGQKNVPKGTCIMPKFKPNSAIRKRKFDRIVP